MAKILIVDDELEVRGFLTKALKAHGFTDMLEAATGTLAIDAARRWRPDLIVMDIQLPDMTGFAAIRQIRRLPGLTTLPIICLTGLDMKFDAAHEGGCTDLLLKPVEPGVLFKAIQRHLIKK
jgi:CheY-like chemotaxis protein